MSKKHVIATVCAWLMLALAFGLAETSQRGWPLSFALGGFGAVALEIYAWGRR